MYLQMYCGIKDDARSPHFVLGKSKWYTGIQELRHQDYATLQ